MNPEERIWENFDEIEAALGGDVRELESTLQQSDTPTTRRTYCRAVFAHAEGLAGWMKRYVVLLYYPGMLGERERKELFERAGALESLYRAFDLFTNTAGAETPLRKNSIEWESIRAGIQIRNRITHAETAKDVSVSDADLEVVRGVHKQTRELVALCLKRSSEALFRRAELVQTAFNTKQAEGATGKPN